MAATFVLSALLVAAQGTIIGTAAQPDSVDQRDVAYEELSAGRSTEAIAELETRLRATPDDPATLINLGTAYARAGDTDRAEKAFRAAMTSDTRYRLELADGSWVDSRQAARRGLEALEHRYPLAALTE